jgi:DNA-binding response OmpR family regulator
MSHFLIVEDFPPMATLLANAIRREGHSVARAGTMAEALVGEEIFDHAILDVDLPDGNGVELAWQLLECGRVISILFFTASRDADLLAKAAKIGLIVDKAAGHDRLMASVRHLAMGDSTARRVAIAGSDESLETHVTGRSGTRRKVDSSSNERDDGASRQRR